jgi:flagellar protein FliL
MAATATLPADPTAAAPGKKSKMPLILGVILALAGGGGGYMAVQMGLIGGAHDAGAGDHAVDESLLPPVAPVAYVVVDPLIVNLPPQSGRTLLRFGAQLEVVPEHQAEVEALKPRIVDVMNGYLRAVEPADFEDPAVLIRLRAQLLRRIQVVAGEGRVRDLLVQEFVLN